MIVPVGALLNAAGIICGGIIGLLLRERASAAVRVVMFQALGLSTLAIAVQMCCANFSLLSGVQTVLVLGCCIGGAAAGELLGIERRLEGLGKKYGKGDFSEGFITAAIMFCVGALCFVGAMDEGLRGDRTLLYTKTLLDFFTGIILASAFGRGVMAAALAVLVVEGGLTMLAWALHPYITETFIVSFSALGAILMFGISINILEIKKIRLANMLPGLLLAIPAQLLL